MQGQLPNHVTDRVDCSVVEVASPFWANLITDEAEHLQMRSRSEHSAPVLAGAQCHAIFPTREPG
jgi:hypothetical protein